MNNINTLLVQAQAAHDTADWSSLIHYLQQLLLTENVQHLKFDNDLDNILEWALSVLTLGDFQQRWEIAKVFNHLGKIAIAPLIDILENEDADEELRSFVTQILGDMKSPDVIAPLTEVLKTDNEEIKAMAATALAKVGPVAIPALTDFLNNEDTCLLAVQALSYIRHKEIITPLIRVAKDAEVAVRLAAIEALASFHDPRVPPVLLNALDDVSASVRREAVFGLSYRCDLCFELDLVTKLKPRLYDFNLDVCCAAVIALSRMNCDAAADPLFQALISPDTPVKLQQEIIRALIWMETPSSLSYLHSALNEVQSVTLWQNIVTALGRANNQNVTDKAAEILLAFLQSKHPAIEITSIRSAIALSLGQLGKVQALEPLMTMLADEDAQVKLHAMAALKNLAINAPLTPELQQAVMTLLAKY